MSKAVPRLSFDAVIDRLKALKKPFQENYLSMYSSWYGGIITDPALMMIPVDDHLVHRGDGIFEAFKCVGWKVYALNRHLDRMERSARASFLTIPMDRHDLVETILETIRASDVPDCSIRIFVSRGPGGFTTNPYECPASQVYIVVTTLPPPPMGKYESGVVVKSSGIPGKKAYFASMKSCNYLPNVLMKKEAVDAGVDFTISVDEDGFIGEGATENIGIITARREFLVPRFDRILRGITISRVMELAETLVSSGDLSRVAVHDLKVEDAYGASEVMMFGTSFDVVPVVKYDDHIISDGRPGPVFRKLLALMHEDVRTGPGMLTPVKEQG